MEKNEKLKLLPIEELIKVLKKKGIKYDKSQIVAPYFPLEDVEACLDDEITADNCSTFFTLPKHLPCPVCGKPGIPDYHNEDVVCPQCKSDLSIYRVIDNIPEEKSGSNIWKPISAVAFLAAAALGVLLLTQKPNSQSDVALVSQLKDSISVLNKQINSYEVNSTKESIGFPYVVRRGDSYCLISRRFYGVDSRAEEIANNNNRSLDTSLSIGDTLYIK